MPVCKRLRATHRKICAGDLRHRIIFQQRNIAFAAGTAEFSEVFTNRDEVKAKITTVRGEVIFDGTGTATNITHHFGVRYLVGITSQTWILFEGNRYDLFDVENLDERNEWLIIPATNRGIATNLASDA